jgi:hypothetical protein
MISCFRNALLSIPIAVEILWCQWCCWLLGACHELPYPQMQLSPSTHCYKSIKPLPSCLRLHPGFIQLIHPSGSLLAVTGFQTGVQ